MTDYDIKPTFQRYLGRVDFHVDDDENDKDSEEPSTSPTRSRKSKVDKVPTTSSQSTSKAVKLKNRTGHGSRK